MDAGQLDRLVQFQRGYETDDGYGVKVTFSDHGAPQWAAKRDVSDGERAAAGWIEATTVSRFTLRWSTFTADIDPRDRLTCEGRAYVIMGVKEAEGRRRWVEITAKALTDTETRTAPVTP